MERKYFAVILIIVLAYGVSFFNHKQSTGAASFQFQNALEDQGGEVASIDAFGQYQVDEAPPDIQAQQDYIPPEIQASPEQLIQQPSTGNIQYLFSFGASTISSFPEESDSFARALLQLTRQTKINIVSSAPSINIGSIFASARPTIFKLTSPTARSLLQAIKTNSR